MNPEKQPEGIKIESTFGDQDNVGQPGEIREFSGRKFRWQDTGYSLREYYSHETAERGPGPGWDLRWDILKKYGVEEPSDLPNDIRVYAWEEIFEDKEK